MYPLYNHLGSVVKLLGAAGGIVPNSHVKYWPYGATRSGGTGTLSDQRYTGQRQEPGDAAMGLYHSKARFYSTTLGRFVSVDPIVGGNPSHSQSLDGYADALNTPVTKDRPFRSMQSWD